MNVLLLISALLTSPEIPAENRLSSSASPYLRQHASNPVDWYPWGDEAIARARRENRPIFLSIGYSTCHWCHVMERESFSNPEVAAVLNEHFISIKVDREEWPDIDSTYLAWLSTTNGDTGWPANLLLTPDLIPFWGGTYFPPRSRDGRPGLIEIAERLGSAWRENPASIAATAKQMRDLVGSVAHSSDAASLARMREVLLNRTLASFDEENGGFSSAPKFPQPSRLLFLLGHANDHDAAANAVRVTLEQIEAGAIHDQVGGGFHRYATDARWRVPHFEKMLYDQAQLALVFAEASVVLRRPDFLATAVDTLEFVERELRLPGGLWAGALGAESGDAAGVVSEGAYYVWSDADLEEAIADRRALRLVRSLYRVNAAEKPLSRATDLAAAAQKLQMDVDTARDLHHQALERLAETRNERPRPFRDEKVITAWNAMAIASFARVGTLADDEHLVEIASSAATRLLELARTREHGLVRSMVNGKGEIPAVADDYSWLIRALLDLFDATGERRWLEAALELDREFRARLGTSNEEYRRSSQSLPLDLIVGPDDGDSAEPWWASVQIENLARLAAITADPEREKQARDLAAAWMPRISRNPQNWPYMIEAIGLTGGRSRQIVISGVDEDESAAAMVETALKRWRRGEVILRVSGSEDPIVRLLPHLQYMKPIAGAATAYVCENYTCRQPAKTVQQLRSQLSENTIPGEVE